MCITVGAAASPGAAPAGIVADAQQRSVLADADASSGLEFNTESKGNQAPGFDAYTDNAAAEGHTLDADAVSSADQMSMISSVEITGTGSTSASGDLRADGLAFAEGDSFLEVLFQVDAPGSYLFSGMLDASGSDGVGQATSELLDFTTEETLASFSVDNGESEDFSSEFILETGVEYVIVASATSTTEIPEAGSGMAMSSYTVSLEFLPEPSADLLFASALATLFGPVFVRSRRRHLSLNPRF